MKNERNLLVGLVFTGIGGPFGDRKQYSFCYGDTSRYEQKIIPAGNGALYVEPEDSQYIWTNALVDHPNLSDTSVNPFQARWNTSGLQVNMFGNDFLSSLFLNQDNYGFNVLQDAIGASQLSGILNLLKIDRAPNNGTTIFIGDEAISVDSFMTVDGLGITTYALRGAFGTTQATHPAGSYVSTQPNYWVPREVKLVYFDMDTGDEWVEWRGYVDDISLNKSKINLKATEFYKRWQGAEANVDAPNLIFYGDFYYQNGRVTGNAKLRSRSRGTNGPIYLQVDEGMIEANFFSTSGTIGFNRLLTDSLMGSRLEDKAIVENGISRRGKVEKIYELLAWDKDRGIGPTLGVDRWHPLRIAQWLITARRPMALELKIDNAAFSAEINATKQFEIDRLILGWNGQPYKPFEEAEKLMRAFGFSPVITTDGKYSVKRYRAFDIKVFLEASKVENQLTVYQDGPLERLPSYTTGAGRIEVKVGGLPWEDTPSLEIITSGATNVAYLQTNAERTVFDMPFIKPTNLLLAGQLITSASTLIINSPPRIKVRVPDYKVTGANFDLLSDVTLADLGNIESAWWVDAEGERKIVGLTTDELALVGRVISRKLIPKNRTFELTLLLINFPLYGFGRERAPSALITSATKLAGNAMEVDVETGFGEYFRTGDDVFATTGRGVRRDNFTFEIQEIDVDTIVLLGDFRPLTAADFFNASYSTFLRCASSAVYSNATSSNEYAAFTDRPYTYLSSLSDDNGLPIIVRESDPKETENADIYAGGFSGI